MRRVDRLVALILGLALAAAAVITGIEVIALVAGHRAVLVPRHAWNHDLATLGWTNSDVAVVGGVLVAVGAVLLLPQLVRRRPVRMVLRSQPGHRLFVSRKALARRLRHDIEQVEDVESAKVGVGRRRVSVAVNLPPGSDRERGAGAVRLAVEATLGQLGPASSLRVRVKATVRTPPTPKKGSRLDEDGGGQLAGAA